MNRTISSCGLLLMLSLGTLWTTPAQAVLYNVVAAPYSAGLGFHGVVNTADDTFTLLSVTDGSGLPAFWTIASPIVMNAFDSSGNPYDVPDAWNGTISGTWGFVGPKLGTITFDQGVPGASWASWSTGWGAMTNSIDDYITSQSHAASMANWPYASDTAAGYWITQPGHGGLTITEIVPEPSAATLALAGSACGSALLWTRRRRTPLTRN